MRRKGNSGFGKTGNSLKIGTDLNLEGEAESASTENSKYSHVS